MWWSEVHQNSNPKGSVQLNFAVWQGRASPRGRSSSDGGCSSAADLAGALGKGAGGEEEKRRGRGWRGQTRRNIAQGPETHPDPELRLEGCRPRKQASFLMRCLNAE